MPKYPPAPKQGCTSIPPGKRGLCTPRTTLLAASHPGKGREDERQTLTANKLIKHLSPLLKPAKHYKAHFLPEAFLSRVPAAWPLETVTV